MKKWIIGIIIVLIVGYFSYKGYLLYKYRCIDCENNIVNTETIFNNNIEVLDIYSSHTSINSLINGTYIPGYEKSENGNFYVLYDDNHEVKSYYFVSIMPQYIDSLSYDYEMTVEDKELVQDKSIKDFLKNNNITNDVDLLTYIKNNYPLHSNIFSTKNAIKNNYMINEFAAIALPIFDSIDLIDNNYGYRINIKDGLKEIHFLHDDNQYIITLGGEDLTSEAFINSLISTIVFD